MMTLKTVKKLLFSDTARDSLIVLGGSGISALLGFVFVSLIARRLGPQTFGVFSTMVNYAVFLSAVIDLGISQSLVRFVQGSKNQTEKKMWISTAGYVVLMLTLGLGSLFSIFYHGILKQLWNHPSGYTLLMAGMIGTITLSIFFLSIFQALTKFWQRSFTDIVFSLFRIGIVVILLATGSVTLGWAIASIILAYGLALGFGWILSREYLGLGFINQSKISPMIGFSRWLGGVNFFANLYGKLDLMMLPWLSSAYITGIYSAAGRVVVIFPLVVSSLSSVIASRFARFQTHADSDQYFKKTVLIALGMVGILSTLIVLAQPLILIAYGHRFIESIPVFQWLVVANLPLVLSIPATNAIVYFYKKPEYITGIVLIQVIGFFILNRLWIPRYEEFGPVYALLVLNTLGVLAQYGLYFYLKKVPISSLEKNT